MNHFWKNTRNSFFAGLVVVVPVAGSILILLGLFDWVTSFLLPAALREHQQGFLYRAVALVVFVALVTLAGWITRWVVGKRLLAMAEALIGRVPLLNRIFGFLKEIGNTIAAGQKTVFQRVVLVEYPRPGAYTIAFATATVGGETPMKTGADMVSVFLPTPPNPTTGYLALFPRAQVVELEMSVSDAMKMSFSGGAVVPPYPAQT